MRVRVLGSGAGGAVPQWNCACRVCRRARAGSRAVIPRSQASVALSCDGVSWFLLHASPDVRQQIESFSPLHPRAARDSPICGVLLASGDLESCLGLLCLRESQQFAIYATGAVVRGFRDGNALVRALERTPGQVRWRELALGAEAPLLDGRGRLAGMDVTAFAVPGVPPVHLDGTRPPSEEDTVALRIRELATGRSLVWAPSVAGFCPELEPLLRAADCVFFDGTFWSSGELSGCGGSTRTAEEMGHWPVGGPSGSLSLLARLPAVRRILIHVNNTNPLLYEYSPERVVADACGVEVARDGLEVSL